MYSYQLALFLDKGWRVLLDALHKKYILNLENSIFPCVYGRYTALYV